jgi:hypothetical protein
MAAVTKNRNQKNTQTPTGIMISTKKQFHSLSENQRQPSPTPNRGEHKITERRKIFLEQWSNEQQNIDNSPFSGLIPNSGSSIRNVS